VVNARDVTEREEIARRLASQAALLRAVAESAPIQTVLEKLTEDVANSLPAPASASCAWRADDSTATSSDPIPEQYAATTVALGTDGTTPCAVAVREQRTVVVPDITDTAVGGGGGARSRWWRWVRACGRAP
jgi:Flp pilus assembly protein TadG